MSELMAIGGIGVAGETDDEIDDAETLIARAEAALAGGSDGFAAAARDELARLDAAFEALSGHGAGAARDPSLRPYFDEAFDAAHDLMAHAATFGWRVLAELCASLCAVIDGRERTAYDPVRAIGEHIAAARLILDWRLAGDGGTVGAALRSELAALRRSLEAGPD